MNEQQNNAWNESHIPWIVEEMNAAIELIRNEANAKIAGILESSGKIGPLEWVPALPQKTEDLHDYLESLDPYCEEDQSEWDRVSDQLEERANYRDMEHYYYEYLDDLKNENKNP